MPVHPQQLQSSGQATVLLTVEYLRQKRLSLVRLTVEECFFVSSHKNYPSHRRGHWRFVLWAHCASVFACACSVLLFTCLHTYAGYK